MNKKNNICDKISSDLIIQFSILKSNLKQPTSSVIIEPVLKNIEKKLNIKCVNEPVWQRSHFLIEVSRHHFQIKESQNQYIIYSAIPYIYYSRVINEIDTIMEYLALIINQPNI